MRNILFYGLFLLTVPLTLSGCAQNLNAPAQEELSITLPHWPPEDSQKEAYPLLSRWQITVTCADYQKSFFSTEEEIIICVKKNRPLSVTAKPITLLASGEECSYFMPAGFIYPANIHTQSNAASWEAGFLAQIMKLLFIEGNNEGLSSIDIEYLVSCFNWKKVQETIDKKIKEENQLFYNPWLLAQAPLLEGIANHSFKSTLLNLTGSSPLELQTLREASGSSSLQLMSSFIPENNQLKEKKQFTVTKNTPILISDAKEYGLFINYKSSKNISLDLIILPIFIEDI